MDDSDAQMHHAEEQDLENPAPGTEYPFAVSDIGRAAVKRLGDGWTCESWPWGVGAYVEHAGIGSFCLGVDEEGDLGVKLDESKLKPEFYAHSAADGLDAAAEWLAAAIRRLAEAQANGGQA
ncbi:hypothetical protein [Streptomyces sp. NPDC001635]